MHRYFKTYFKSMFYCLYDAYFLFQSQIIDIMKYHSPGTFKLRKMLAECLITFLNSDCHNTYIEKWAVVKFSTAKYAGVSLKNTCSQET